MRRLAVTGGLLLVVIAAASAVCLLLFRGPGDRRAILVSAGIALVVQSLSFTVSHNAPPRRMLAARLAGSALRFLSLLIYAFLVIGPLELPPQAALLSFAGLLFASTVLEPRLLSA